MSKPVYIIEKEKIDKLAIYIADAIISRYDKGYGFKCVNNETKEIMGINELTGAISGGINIEILNDLGIE